MKKVGLLLLLFTLTSAPIFSQATTPATSEHWVSFIDEITYGLAVLVGTIAGAIILLRLVGKNKMKSFKGKVAGQELEWNADQVTPEMIRQQIKTSVYVYRRIEEVQREITIQQKNIAKPFKPLFIEILRSPATCGDEHEYQIAWREFLDILYRACEQNHILEKFQDGLLSDEYLESKLLEAQLDYRVGAGMKSWLDIDQHIRDLLLKFFCRMRDISQKYHLHLIKELLDLQGLSMGMPVVVEIISEEITAIQKKLK